MKVGIISDTHGSLTAWEQAWSKYFSRVELIIHCGDILYHGPRNPLPEGYNPAALAEKLNQCPIPILFAKGNCDAEVDQLLINSPIEGPYLHCYLNDWRILVHHGHASEKIHPQVYSDYNLIISGHTHLPVLETNTGTIFLNPGSPALPKTTDKQPSLALLDDQHINIINLSTGAIIHSN